MSGTKQTSQSRLQTHHAELCRVIELMNSDGESNFMRGLTHTLELFQRAMNESESCAQLIEQAADTFLSMWGGMGSLDEYYITGGPSKTLTARRAEYDALTKSLIGFFRSY